MAVTKAVVCLVVLIQSFPIVSSSATGKNNAQPTVPSPSPPTCTWSDGSCTAVPEHPLPLLAIRTAQVAYPTGDKSFKVFQAFPAAVTAEEADPFLMCDEFGPTVSNGLSAVDEYPVGWHPHAGMDIMTYLVEGVGRHADSLGNRGTFAAPGMQWMSAGSGVEHAEGGGTPVNMVMHGFQIWVNVPMARKFDAPKYGTANSTDTPENLPTVALGEGVKAIVLAGSVGGSKHGPFRTVQSVHMLDVTVEAGARMVHKIPENHNSALIYLYKGSALIAGQTVQKREVALLDASDPSLRDVDFRASDDGARFMLFTGQRVLEPIAWHGPIVMSSQEQLHQLFGDMRRGNFPPKRAAWDYKTAAATPPEYIDPVTGETTIPVA